MLLGPEVDFYALGVTVYVIMTGEDPFSERNNARIMRDTIEGRVVDDLLTSNAGKKLSPRVRKLIQGLLTVRHDKRWKAAEIDQWLKGEDVPVFKDVVRDVPPFRFGSADVTSLEDLAMACKGDREMGKKFLYRGMIGNWVERFDQTLALKVGDIASEYNGKGWEDYGLARLIFFLAPSEPYVAPTGDKVNNIADLVELLHAKGASIADALASEKSELHAWMQSHDMNEFAKSCTDAATLDMPNKTRFINGLLVSIQWDAFKPFTGHEVEFTGKDGLMHLGADYRDQMLALLEDADSQASLWFTRQFGKQANEAWRSGDFEHTWTNLSEVMQNHIEISDGIWKTAADMARNAEIAEQERLQREEEEKQAAQRQAAADRMRLDEEAAEVAARKEIVRQECDQTIATWVHKRRGRHIHCAVPTAISAIIIAFCGYIIVGQRSEQVGYYSLPVATETWVRVNDASKPNYWVAAARVKAGDVVHVPSMLQLPRSKDIKPTERVEIEITTKADPSHEACT